MGVTLARKGAQDVGKAIGMGVQDATRQIGFRAYHGSPYSYNRVDLSKVGTGEGAQAFGHGYYAADLESLGKTYRDQTSAGTFKTASGDVFNPQRELQALPVRVAANRNGADLDATIERARRALETVSPNARPLVEADLAKLEKLKAEGGISPNQGHMYEVQINADKNSLLDWDKRIADQTPEVQRAIMTLPTAHKIDPEMTGGAFYQSAHLVSGDVYDKKAASDALRKLGVPGIQYLDAGSRFNPSNLPDNPMANEARQFLQQAGGDVNAALQLFRDSNPVTRWATTERDEIAKVIRSAANPETRNYVVFDENLIEILRKYGLLPVAGGAAAYGAAQGSEPQPQGLF